MAEDKVEKSKVKVTNQGEGARVVSDVVSGSVLLQPGETKEVEMSKEGVDHYKAKAEKGGDITFGEPKDAEKTKQQAAEEEREKAERERTAKETEELQAEREEKAKAAAQQSAAPRAGQQSATQQRK